jgi:uncharacterized protein (TIGR03437 family)
LQPTDWSGFKAPVPSSIYPGGYEPTEPFITSADLNRDGYPDLVIGAPTGVGVLLNAHDGTFKGPVYYRTKINDLWECGYVISIAVGDFNGDHKLDLASTCLNLGGGISILLGKGDGTFEPVKHIPMKLMPNRLVAVDLNKDGKDDLIGGIGTGVEVLISTGGTGSFQPETIWDTGDSPFGGDQAMHWIVIDDFNLDGNIDLLLVNNGSSTVSLLAGNGNGTFRPAVQTNVNVLMPVHPNHAASADIDGDGWPDLAVATLGGPTILLNNRDGTFRALPTRGAVNDWVALHDMNGDGKPDLITCGMGFPVPVVDVFLGEGNGNFRPPVEFEVHDTPRSLVVGDFNRDGKPDVAVLAYTYMNVLLGTASPASPASDPVITSIVDGASFGTVISGDAFVTIFGQNLATETLGWNAGITDTPDGKMLPKELGGVSVRLGFYDCYVAYVSPTQINILTPLLSGTYALEYTAVFAVTTARGEIYGTAWQSDFGSNLFSYPTNGRQFAVAMFGNTNVLVAPAGAIPGASSHPAKPGDYIELFANGLGFNLHPAGRVLDHDAPVTDLSQIGVSIGGVPATVTYAGMTFAGVYQINVQVPAGIGHGELPVVVSVSGRPSDSSQLLVFENP